MIVRQKNLFKNQKGQSLLEMLIALFILITALTATIVLIVTSINAGRESKYKLIATSLAREGIEVARNIRDSNWIDPANPSPAWDSGLTWPGDDPTAILKIDGINPIALDFDINDFININARIKQNNNLYLQGGAAAGNDTNFYRLLYLNPICRRDSDGDEKIVAKDTYGDCTSFGTGGDYIKVGIRVISEVRWSGPVSGRKVQIEDRLYDWQLL